MAVFKGHCRENCGKGGKWEDVSTDFYMSPHVLTVEYDDSLSPAVPTLCSRFDRCKWRWNPHGVQKISLNPHTLLVGPDTSQLKHRFISVTTQFCGKFCYTNIYVMLKFQNQNFLSHSPIQTNKIHAKFYPFYVTRKV